MVSISTSHSVAGCATKANLSRRSLLSSLALLATPALAVIPRKANAATVRYKLGSVLVASAGEAKVFGESFRRRAGIRKGMSEREMAHALLAYFGDDLKLHLMDGGRAHAWHPMGSQPGTLFLPDNLSEAAYGLRLTTLIGVVMITPDPNLRLGSHYTMIQREHGFFLGERFAEGFLGRI